MREEAYKIEEIYEIFTEYPQVCTDSRQIIPDSIFFALKGANFDGNRFVEQALEQGCAFAVSDDAELARRLSGCILVDEVQKALQELAAMHRRRLNIPVLMVTGTNGKTTTKELLKATLSKKYSTSATQGNLNNHIGAPLTLLAMDSSTQFAVIEAGANHAGEIAELCKIVAPDYGLITNVGKAHLEGFGSPAGVKIAKGELYDYLEKTGGLAFYNADDEEISSMAQARINLRREAYGARLYGASAGATDGAQLMVVCSSPAMDIATQLAGEYNLNNVLAAVGVGLHFGIPASEISAALSDFSPNNNRSQVILAGCNTVIMDAYNANPSSMEAAIENFAKLSGRKIAVLGDMLELGDDADAEHISTLKLADSKGFEQILLVGECFAAASASDEFRTAVKVFRDKSEVQTYLQNNPLQGFTILVKASRGIALESLREVFLRI